MREGFAGAAGMDKFVRWRLDPRDTRTDADWYALVGDNDGMSGCTALLARHDVCPRNLPLAAPEDSGAGAEVAHGIAIVRFPQSDGGRRQES